MVLKKRILISGLAFYLLSGAIAHAEINVNLDLGGPAYAVASPVYVSPYPQYYDPGHRRHDYGYWQGQRRAQGHQEHQDNGRQEGRNNSYQNHGEQGRGDHERR